MWTYTYVEDWFSTKARKHFNGGKECLSNKWCGTSGCPYGEQMNRDAYLEKDGRLKSGAKMINIFGKRQYARISSWT